MDDFGYDDDTNTTPLQKVKTNYEKIEELILPLLDNLINSSDKDKINWPNRKEPLEKLKADILKLTRGE